MNNARQKTIPLAFHCKLSSSFCPSSNEEKVMSYIWYVSTIGGLIYAMKWLDISHVVGVVSGYIANLGRAMKCVIQYFQRN